MIKKTVIAVVLILAALFLFVCYGRKDLTLSKMEVKAKYTGPYSKFLQWKGAEIHYTDDGAGFPVLMIHGFGGSTENFYLLDSLIRDKYRVIRVDLPGFGMSDFPDKDESHEDYNKVYTDFFDFFLDTLHLDSMYVMGNSLGGLMSWNLALHHPDKVKKMILFNSAGYDMSNVIKSANAVVFRKTYIRMMLHKGLPMYFTQRASHRIFYNRSYIDDKTIQRMNDLWNRDGNLSHIFAMANSDQFLDTALIKGIKCPTLIIWGKQDQIVPYTHAERFHRDIKNSRVIIYDSCGHVPMMELPFEVKRDVLKFLSE